MHLIWILGVQRWVTVQTVQVRAGSVLAWAQLELLAAVG